jgi:hypothetical protein
MKEKGRIRESASFAEASNLRSRGCFGGVGTEAREFRIQNGQEPYEYESLLF